jgi:hypothetical protein
MFDVIVSNSLDKCHAVKAYKEYGVSDRIFHRPMAQSSDDICSHHAGRLYFSDCSDTHLRLGRHRAVMKSAINTD